MVVNKAKSGIMPLGRNAIFPGETALGYPIISRYKYLGMELDRDISFTTHLKSINAKIAFLTHRLSVLRYRDNLKLNKNLF